MVHVADCAVSLGYLLQFARNCVPDGFSTADVVQRIVKPATNAQRCRYVSLASVPPSAVGRSQYFISHRWGADFTQELVALVAGHFADAADASGTTAAPGGLRGPADGTLSAGKCPNQLPQAHTLCHSRDADVPSAGLNASNLPTGIQTSASLRSSVSPCGVYSTASLPVHTNNGRRISSSGRSGCQTPVTSPPTPSCRSTLPAAAAVAIPPPRTSSMPHGPARHPSLRPTKPHLRTSRDYNEPPLEVVASGNSVTSIKSGYSIQRAEQGSGIGAAGGPKAYVDRVNKSSRTGLVAMAQLPGTTAAAAAGPVETDVLLEYDHLELFDRDGSLQGISLNPLLCHPPCPQQQQRRPQQLQQYQHSPSRQRHQPSSPPFPSPSVRTQKQRSFARSCTSSRHSSRDMLLNNPSACSTGFSPRKTLAYAESMRLRPRTPPPPSEQGTATAVQSTAYDSSANASPSAAALAAAAASHEATAAIACDGGGSGGSGTAAHGLGREVSAITSTAGSMCIPASTGISSSSSGGGSNTSGGSGIDRRTYRSSSSRFMASGRASPAFAPHGSVAAAATAAAATASTTSSAATETAAPKPYNTVNAELVDGLLARFVGREQLLRETFVWLDIFAINQHPDTTQAEDLSKLQEVVGSSQATLLVLDGDGQVLTRIWCLYEIWQTVRQRGAKGLRVLAGQLHHTHLARVWGDLEVERAQATVEADHVRILADIRADTGAQQLNQLIKRAIVESACHDHQLARSSASASACHSPAASRAALRAAYLLRLAGRTHEALAAAREAAEGFRDASSAPGMGQDGAAGGAAAGTSSAASVAADGTVAAGNAAAAAATAAAHMETLQALRTVAGCHADLGSLPLAVEILQQQVVPHLDAAEVAYDTTTTAALPYDALCDLGMLQYRIGQYDMSYMTLLRALYHQLRALHLAAPNATPQLVGAVVLPPPHAGSLAAAAATSTATAAATDAWEGGRGRGSRSDEVVDASDVVACTAAAGPTVVAVAALSEEQLTAAMAAVHSLAAAVAAEAEADKERGAGEEGGSSRGAKGSKLQGGSGGGGSSGGLRRAVEGVGERVGLTLHSLGLVQWERSRRVRGCGGSSNDGAGGSGAGQECGAGLARRARQLLEASVELLDVLSSAEGGLTALDARSNLAMMVMEGGELESCERLLRATLALTERVYGSAHPHTATAMNNLALCLKRSRRAPLLAESVSLYRRCLAVCGRELGEEHPETLAVAVNLGVLLADMRQWSESEALLTRAVACSSSLLYNHQSHHHHHHQNLPYNASAKTYNTSHLSGNTNSNANRPNPHSGSRSDAYRAASSSSSQFASFTNGRSIGFGAGATAGSRGDLGGAAAAGGYGCSGGGGGLLVAGGAAGPHPDAMAAHRRLAEVLECRNKLFEAEAMFRITLQLAESCPPDTRDHGLVLESLEGLARVQARMEQAVRAQADGGCCTIS
ncbi:hypothetical protein Agub_g12459 [Astrephomene gubernaculifera]|uniref:Uncharacterized protein n=1 Tax=Astrephomene gubernaculifera TaxID=47775 RepID=A0AAD3HRL2_9CHLO|nr:hypothetical protein Agub_g12459 [Astrephomene gubernaculifera]